jgi:hypothetical protein
MLGYFSFLPLGIRISYRINILAMMSLISLVAKKRPGLDVYPLVFWINKVRLKP